MKDDSFTYLAYIFNVYTTMMLIEKFAAYKIYNWILNLYRNFYCRGRIFSDSSLHVVTVVGTPFDVLLGRIRTTSVITEETDKILKAKIIVYI